jgi:mono/diheme cytochrome c family protein
MADLLQMKKYWLSAGILLAAFTFSACSGRHKAADETNANTGEQVFLKYCMSCHQVSGGGVPGMYPTLHETDWVNGDKTRLITLLLKGQQGPITVNGNPFQGVMPPHDYLTDKQIADVLSYIRSNFGNHADAVTEKEVTDRRAQLAPR